MGFDFVRLHGLGNDYLVMDAAQLGCALTPELYSTQSFKGEITHWVYDSFYDSIYMSGFPQMEYHRYKG